MTALAEWDWVIDYSIDEIDDEPSDDEYVLHHLATDDGWDEDDGQGDGTTSCGLTRWWSIPGFFSRGGVTRCPECCDAVGYPHGVGSPKNDDACRPLVEARIAKAGS